MIYADPRKESIDMSLYGPDAAPSETKYGLPPNVQFCRKCVISNQRPNSAVEYKHTADSKKTVIAFD